MNWRDIRNPEAGGSEIYVHSLCKELVRMGHEVSLCSAAFPGASSHEEIDGVKVSRHGNSNSVYWSFFRKYLTQRPREHHDVVLESINTIPFFTPLYVSEPVVALIYSIYNRRVLVREMGVTPVVAACWAASTVIPVVYKKATTITISESSRKELISFGFKPSKVYVAHPAVDNSFGVLEKATPKTQRPNTTIIYVGRLKKYKGIETILQALSILAASRPIELLIVGKGDYESQLRQRVRDMHLNDFVRFCGFLPEDKKVAALMRSSVFVCCSIDEGGWTIAGLEALRCGVPLVVTQSQSDLVVDGVTGFVARDDRAELVADKIAAALDGDWLRMSGSARYWSAKYTWEHAARTTLEALKSAMVTKPS